MTVIGSYETAIQAINSMNFPVIGTIGIGVVVGILLMSKIMKYLLENFKPPTYSVIIGLVAGSTFAVYPGGQSYEFCYLSVCILTFLLGVFPPSCLKIIQVDE